MKATQQPTSIIFLSGILPTVALFYVIAVPLLTDFESITRTHCYRAKNFLPSVSAAIGYNFSTILIWFTLISLHTPFRFKLANQINSCYRVILEKMLTQPFEDMSVPELIKYKRLIRCVRYSHWFNRLEIIGLLLLSVFSSNGNYGKFFEDVVVVELNSERFF